MMDVLHKQSRNGRVLGLPIRIVLNCPYRLFIGLGLNFLAGSRPVKSHIHTVIKLDLSIFEIDLELNHETLMQ